MRVNYIEVLVGAVIVVVAAFFFSYAYHANRGTSGFTFEAKAKFDRVDGILLGSDVKMRGIKIGEVTKLSLIGDTLIAELTFGLYKDYRLPIDSSVEVSSEGIMGPKYIAIVPGENDIVLKNEEYLKYTQSSISLENLIAKFVFSSGSSNQDKK
jgi:phospholipid/cholesterol/gamma-HCH transport system substrate-binding protein